MGIKINAPDGVTECTVTGVGRQELHYGKDATTHMVMRVEIKPAIDDGNEYETYYAELPLIFTVGKPWDFYDKATNKSVQRNTTAKDTEDAWGYARQVFPAWAKYIDDLPPSATPLRDALAWFDNHLIGSRVTAKLRNREYAATDGTTKTAHDATLYATFEHRPLVDENFDANFNKQLLAAKVKIGKMTGAAAKAPTAPTASTKTTIKPQQPQPPRATAAKVYTGDDSWEAYAKNHPEDESGEDYWRKVGEITRNDPTKADAFTSDDWRKCVEAFNAGK